VGYAPVPQSRLGIPIRLAVAGVALILGAAAPGCNAPAWPERDGAAHLERRGWPEETIDRVVRGEPLAVEELRELSRLRSDDVRFLLARNRHLPREWMERFASDPDDFVRSGLAYNPSLPPDLAERLRVDPSHTVWTGLAANPGLDEAFLLRLFEEKEMEPFWFARNPRCPPEIERRIRESGDARALRYLERRGEEGAEG